MCLFKKMMGRGTETTLGATVLAFKVLEPILMTLTTQQRRSQSDGLPSRGTRLHDLVHEGLPFEYLERIASLLQMQPGVITKAICIAPSTLARRAKVGRFNAVESDRLVALVAVFEKALSLLENDKAAATKLMSSPVRGLGSRCPLDMLGTIVETNAVFDIIYQLEKGVLM
ncbi:antitoxin Xre-like helix-turn-helix domain-containing protein [Pseudomonas sp. GM48]|uniref:antitoxin Xre-like helix-turn-helix domain-containing protein n=1 Tax=Pseudomonas sp. GM48 TaxID=1144330 RepID=UPI001EE67AEE|nr:antitoxin Xre-like helix-turn-helix domain-containing protein [Pseudomonas sp. GM48]